ncbi:citrate synthase family protein [Dyella sp.]|jgi:citrate synthase|uniref:citrate synthase family protein n=1 Tax=Dyella sp. TaxID=1869338 RepID=UPI002D76837E|nr:citrate synthase family protein [Dyella sp.]HET6432525.1 citrate synthase family protein [Dyella sp.]
MLINLDLVNQYVGMATDYLSASTAADRLGVSLATLYAYVSRGKIHSRPGPDGRSRVYRADDIAALIERRLAGRGAAQGAAHSLTWGLPVMETRISLIRPHGHYYRGQSALALASAGATLEDTARLLWDAREHDPFADRPPRTWPAAVAGLLRQRDLPPLERAAAALPLLALAAPCPHAADAEQERLGAALLLRESAALLCGRRPDGRPIHAGIAAHWAPAAAELPALVRSALVLCADHELNASAFAARVAASTGASLHACASAGLAALSGPLHGGATARAHALIVQSLRQRQPGDLVRGYLRRGEALAGFGHRLYPEGDPRAALLLAQLQTLHPRRAALRGMLQLADAVQQQGGLPPSLDFALAAIAIIYGRSVEAALALFAAGRMAGWLAHALEQRADGGLIRPRATYAGIVPHRPADR